jgi:hypothetical protein
MRPVSQWLVHLSDPIKPLTRRPQQKLDSAQARELIEGAERHGTLAALASRIELALQEQALEAAKADAASRQREAVAFSLMLRTYTQGLVRQISAARLPAIIVKGPVFASKLYPQRHLRRFTDIDLLVDSSALSPMQALLTAEGFELAETENHEWKWIIRDNPVLAIEVQTNLVHAASLLPAVSLTHADLVANGFEDAERPPELLVVAAVHGACHAFERLVHVVDVCQAARLLTGTGNERRLDALMKLTGSRFAVVSALDLAARLFAEPRCAELAAAIAPVRYRRLARALLTPAAITSTMSRTRVAHSWRRSGFRELLKRGTARQG